MVRDLPLTLAFLLLLLPSALDAAGDAKPQLVLQVDGLAEEVYPGDFFATVGDVTYFYLFEHAPGEDAFSIQDDTYRVVLWRTDGTRGGTFPLHGPDTSLFTYSDTLGEILFFTLCEFDHPLQLGTGDGCDFSRNVHYWRTDGTEEGTSRLIEVEGRRAFPLDRAVPDLGLYFFVTVRADGGFELWATDGTKQGARIVRDLASAGFTFPSAMESFGGELYFTALRKTDSFPTWLGRTDGTAEGTVLFPTPSDGGFPRPDVEVGGDDLFFLFSSPSEEKDPATGRPLRRLTLRSIQPGEEAFLSLGELGFLSPGVTTGLRAEDGRAFLTRFHDPSLDVAIWGSDGTPASLQSLVQTSIFTPGHYLSVRTDPLALSGGGAFLVFPDETAGIEPWVSDGTAVGTRMLADLCPGECSSRPWGLGLTGGETYLFAADDGVHGREIWRWRPVDDVLEPVGDLCPGECSSNPRLVGELEDRLFFVTTSPTGSRALWQSDTRGSNPRPVADLAGLEIDLFQVFFGRQAVLWELALDRWSFWGESPETGLALWSLEIPETVPPAPPGPALTTDELPGFAVKVRIGGAGGLDGRAEAECIPETLCVSGALPGRSEVFVRVVGPKPNGKLWPTLVKFTTSEVEVWIEQLATGAVRYYRLEGATPGSSDLPGLFDRDGFSPAG